MSKRNSLFILVFMLAFVPACLLNTGFHKKDGKYVYADSAELSYEEHPIPGADTETFQILNKHGYAKDKLSVFYKYTRVEGADPASFESISELYGKDNEHVYYEFHMIPDADPATFKLFNIQWGRDAKDVYLQYRPIEACDPETFELMKITDWQRDSQCVYFQGRKAPDADPASFVVLNFSFGKDKNHVYSNDPSIIEGADPVTFKIQEVCRVCGEDKNGCYVDGKKASCPPK